LKQLPVESLSSFRSLRSSLGEGFPPMHSPTSVGDQRMDWSAARRECVMFGSQPTDWTEDYCTMLGSHGARLTWPAYIADWMCASDTPPPIEQQQVDIENGIEKRGVLYLDRTTEYTVPYGQSTHTDGMRERTICCLQYCVI